jgi:hypothetical protein
VVNITTKAISMKLKAESAIRNDNQVDELYEKVLKAIRDKADNGEFSLMYRVKGYDRKTMNKVGRKLHEEDGFDTFGYDIFLYYLKVSWN